MNTRALTRALTMLASMMVLGAAGEANAGLFRTYLSVNGNDANACSLTAPCRLLPAALAAVNAGGEIWMLDSANFNTATVSINKSLTILAVPGALGSVVANGTDAINITAPGVSVTLRNVVILNLAGTTNTGIVFAQGNGLTLEGCEIYGLSTGISSTAVGATVNIKDTTIRDNTAAGVSVQGASKLQLLNASVLNNAIGIAAVNGAGVAITGGTISGGTTAGVQASASGSTNTQVAISGSTLAANTLGLQVTAAGAGDVAAAMINKTTFTQNGTGVTISGSGAKAYSLTNNAFKFNSADVGGSLTALAPQ
jgi:hypothetical protein